MKVGFIGLGTMGSSIAMNAIRAGHSLTVYDINKGAAQPHLEAGATWVENPADLAVASDVIFTSLPGPKEVEMVAVSDDGLLRGFRPGQAWFDLTTNSPTLMRELHSRFKVLGVETLDAPVSGGPEGARTGKMAIWVGGDRATYERHLPVLRSMADKPAYVGPIGTGAIAKLVHNLSGYVIQTALAEAFTMGVKAGVEADALWEAVRQGAQGRRRTFDGLARNYLRGRFDPPDFTLRLAHKDVTLAVEVGRDYDVPMRLANLVHQEMTEALNRGWGERDSRISMLLQEERAGGVEVRIDPERIKAIIEDE